jgi:hypothetical protein
MGYYTKLTSSFHEIDGPIDLTVFPSNQAIPMIHTRNAPWRCPPSTAPPTPRGFSCPPPPAPRPPPSTPATTGAASSPVVAEAGGAGCGCGCGCGNGRGCEGVGARGLFGAAGRPARRSPLQPWQGAAAAGGAAAAAERCRALEGTTTTGASLGAAGQSLWILSIDDRCVC